MSRTSQSTNYVQVEDYQEGGEFEIVPKVICNEPLEFDSSKKVHLIDADSIIWFSHYNPNLLPEERGTEEDVEECKYRLRTKIQEISNNVERWFNITDTILCVGGKNNFRYKLFPEYKAQRPKDIHPNIGILKEYIINELGAIAAPFGEADDTIYHLFKKVNENSLISCIDKDIKSSCWGHFYNYKSYPGIMGEFYYVTEQESKFNLCCQILTGDVSDNIKVNKGLGVKGVLKIINPEMSDFTLKRKILETYIKYNGDKAKELLKQTYKLLKLHTFEEIEAMKIN